MATNRVCIRGSSKTIHRILKPVGADYLFPSILLTNARSLKNKIDDIHATTEIHKPDVIAITETWFSATICDYCKNITYIQPSFHKDQAESANREGVALYIRNQNTTKIINCVNVPEHLHSIQPQYTYLVNYQELYQELLCVLYISLLQLAVHTSPYK